MKCLSFNYRGLASSPKKLALRRLFTAELVDLILIQETLGEAHHVSKILQAICPRWIFTALDAMGRFGGLAMGYNPRSIKPIST